jgi:hypothetical protein
MADTRTKWGARAAALYTDAYAERYRAHDEAIHGSETVARLDEWLRDASSGRSTSWIWAAAPAGSFTR